MKAVNLIPEDARRAQGVQASWKVGPAYLAIGLLGIAVLLVTVYVLTSNTISDRRAKLAALQGQVATEQAQAGRLAAYTNFVRLAQTRADTIRQIASTRFDWHAALADLSNVVPSNTSLQELTGTVAPGASVSGAGGSVGGAGGSGSSLRGNIAAPAFEMQGCTRTQDDVARLMSRLRLINGVQRVTLANSSKQDSVQSGPSVATSAGSSAGAVGCGRNAPTFDLVVFFQPLPGAAAASPMTGGGTATAASAAGTATAPTPVTNTPAPTTPTPTTPTSTTPAPTTPASTTPASTSQQVTNSVPTRGGSK